jgi:hypothetical protein
LHEDAHQAAREEAARAGEQLARTEIGDEYALIENDIVTEDRLMADLAIQEQMDVLIDRCVKRLLMLRGFKSMAISLPVIPRIANSRGESRSSP